VDITPSVGLIADLELEGQYYAYSEITDCPGNPIGSYFSTDGGVGGTGSIDFGNSYAALTVGIDIPTVDILDLTFEPLADLVLGLNATNIDFDKDTIDLIMELTLPSVDIEFRDDYLLTISGFTLDFSPKFDIPLEDQLSGEVQLVSVPLPPTPLTIDLTLTYETTISEKGEIWAGSRMFPAEWETTPFVEFEAELILSLSCGIVNIISTNLTTFNTQLLLKGRGELDGDFSVDGAQDYSGTVMDWKKSGDIRDAFIYPELNRDGSRTEDVISRVEDLTYSLKLIPTLRFDLNLNGRNLFTIDWEIATVSARDYNTDPVDVEVEIKS
jgi:hypothetical protein